ncbi:FadR/GntR family transcriptional regulator [Ruania zhangjianzhongii]|uniref:FadR/GntR family transcriptional regulator n=1 Tax=Ruania zhangjianzhongii TaxID=2603206 RepID=UPI0011C8BB2B|nr:FCD domain-containing protein [Ruania zhangjianzhongii]
MATDALHHHVADALGRRIVEGTLPVGSAVSLASLEQEFRVSRTVAREAARLLESLGLMVARRRVGLIVADFEHWNVLSPRVIEWRLAGRGRNDQLKTLLDLRIAVEPTAARSAAEQASAEARERLIELASKLRDLGKRGLGQTPEYLRTDVDFHQTMLRASGNEMLAALDQVVEAVLIGRTRLGLSPAVPVAEVIDHHETTAKAIAAQMPEAAELYSRLLVTRVRAEFAL